MSGVTKSKMTKEQVIANIKDIISRINNGESKISGILIGNLLEEIDKGILDSKPSIFSFNRNKTKENEKLVEEFNNALYTLRDRQMEKKEKEKADNTIANEQFENEKQQYNEVKDYEDLDKNLDYFKISNNKFISLGKFLNYENVQRKEMLDNSQWVNVTRKQANFKDDNNINNIIVDEALGNDRIQLYTKKTSGGKKHRSKKTNSKRKHKRKTMRRIKH